MAPRRSRSDLRPHLDRAGLPPLRKPGRRLIDTVDVETVRAVELALGSEQSVNVFRRDWTHAVASTLGFLDFPNLRIQGKASISGDSLAASGASGMEARIAWLPTTKTVSVLNS